MEKIYIEYSIRDIEFARRLSSDLIMLGFTVSADFFSIRPGDIWQDKIKAERDTASIFLVCLSQHTIAHDWFKFQIDDLLKRVAAERPVQIIPILLDISWGDLREERSLAPLLERHGVNLADSYEACLGEILRAITPPGIFISYRRDDSAEVCDRIYEKLAERFGRTNLVRDIESIPLGTDFRAYLANVIRMCAVALVVIGKDWATIADKTTGEVRLQNPADFVRLEIEAALNRNIAVVPVLVSGASMPSEADLPVSITGIVYRNGVTVRREPDFKSDMERLITGIEAILSRY